jgi:peptidoglycan/xylan/chitin deacetylase (PgdA/CDA1 family)
MRPVGGSISEKNAEICPYAVVRWSVDTRDWETNKTTGEKQSVQAIVDEILKETKDGSIILMHDIQENTPIAFARAAAILAEEGYEFVTVSELLGDDLAAGEIFREGKPITAVGSQK